jgi:hypothetical protein
MKRRIRYGILVAALLIGNGLLIGGLVFASGNIEEDNQMRTYDRSGGMRDHSDQVNELKNVKISFYPVDIPDELPEKDQSLEEWIQQEEDEEERDPKNGVIPELTILEVIEELEEENSSEGQVPLEEGSAETNLTSEEGSTSDDEQVVQEEVQEEQFSNIIWEEPFGNNRDPDQDSPEIYFHVKHEVSLDLAVHIRDGVTKTIPEVEMGPKAFWEKIVARPDGSIEYNGRMHEMLYYEGRFVNAYGPSNMGWKLEKVDGQLYFDNHRVTEKEILGILMLKMMASGLEFNEVEFLIRRMIDMDMLDFDTKYLFIRYIPQDSVDEAICLDAPDHFSVMRRHFLLEDSDISIEMEEPNFEPCYGDFIIHETAVNRI